MTVEERRVEAEAGLNPTEPHRHRTEAGSGIPLVGVGPGQVEAPDVIGLELLEAHRLARQHGLRLAVTVWETKIGPWGMVLSQQPGEGNHVQPGARIQVVAAGRPHLTVPDVRGLETGIAVQVLRRIGLLPLNAEERASRLVPPGHVIATRPRAGTLVVDGERVTLVTACAATPRSSRLKG